MAAESQIFDNQQNQGKIHAQTTFERATQSYKAKQRCVNEINYAKQSQFSKSPNEHKLLFAKGL